MYTKEDIEKAKQYLDDEGYGTGSNFTLNMVANLMAEYAAKNCVMPAVIGSVCDGCGSKFDDMDISVGVCYCCQKEIKQTDL